MANTTVQIFTIKSRPVSRVQLPVAAATKIPYGTLCCFDSAGNIVNGADTSGYTYAGQSDQNIDNSTGAAGDLTVQIIPPTVDQNQYLQIPCTSPDQTWENKLVYLKDNQSVALSASVTNHVVVGRVFSVDATGTSGLVTVDTAQKSTLATSGA